MKIIIYGTGDQAKLALDWLRKKYADEDIVGFTRSHYQGYGETLYGKPIISEQKLRYSSDAENLEVKYYISPVEPVFFEIQSHIIDSGIAKREHILNYVSATKYSSCFELENSVIIANDGLVTCCFEPGKNASSVVAWKNDIEETIDGFVEKKRDLIHKLKSNIHNPCAGCGALKERYWRDEKIIETINIGLSFPCQLACCYCRWPCNARYLSKFDNNKVLAADKINVPLIINALEAKGIFPNESMIGIASGEITIAKNRDEILDACGKHPVGILSNGIIYNERIAELTSRDNLSYLNVSVDAGTRETYRQVKGMDAFNDVCLSLKKYHYSGSSIQLKYICLNNNCDENDLVGFLKIVSDVNPEMVMISYDFSVGQNGISETVLNGAAFLVAQLKKMGRHYELVPAFGKENLDYIRNGGNVS